MALTKAANRMINGSEVNVLDYGAYNDGTNAAATTTAIQAALDVGGVVRFPAGTYLTDGQLTVGSNTHVVGYGATITTSANLFHDQLGVMSADNVTVEGITIKAQTGEDAIDDAFKINSSTNVTAIRCRLENIGRSLANPVTGNENGFGFTIGSSTDVRVIDCVIKDIKGIGQFRGDFVYMNNCKDVLIEGCTMSGSSRQGIAIVTNNQNITIQNNFMTDIALAGIDIEPNTTPDTSYMIIKGNHIENFAAKSGPEIGAQFNGIDFRGDESENIIIEGNIIIAVNAQSQHCIKCQNLATNAIIANNILDCAGIADTGLTLYSGNGAKKLSINNNQIYGCVTHGIDANNNNDISITNNVINASTDCIGISIGSGNLVNIANNTLNIFNSTSIGINVQNTEHSVAITGNIVRKDQGDGIRVYQSGTNVAKACSVSSNICHNSTTNGTGILVEYAASGSIDDVAVVGNVAGGFTTPQNLPTNANEILLPDLPTSSSGLATGQVWNNSNVLNIV